MRNVVRLALAIATMLAVTGMASAAHAQLSDPEIGAPAPAFTLQDTHGNQHALTDYRGQWVVLEWLNYECPYVRKHYNSGNMQQLQKTYGDKGVAWLAIVSSAPGKQGYFPPEEMNARSAAVGSNATAVLLDSEGNVGRAYGARTTPQMVVIDPEGTLLYIGGIDDKPTTRVSDIEGAHNHVAAALDEAMAGQPVSRPRSQPYGCSVKY